MTASKSSNPILKDPLEEIFSHLGRPCAVSLILALGERAHNAGVREIRRIIDSSGTKAASESTLTKCLTELATLGLVQRTEHEESPSEAGYSLTHVGREIYRHILQIRHWAELTSNGTDDIESNVSAC
ncbi:MAG: transcriptional regulator [Candidatus Thorarchaeota archaeon]|nr:transcriptional regulator [Candidatus Thorarchaeota archaeon]